MSVYPPPSFTEYIPIFNPINWEATIDEGITIAYLNSHFLNYPVAQGLQTFSGIVNLSDTTLDTNLIMTGTSLTNYIEFPDTTKQYTAFTGTLTPLVPSPVGTYTSPSSVVVNSAGQITSATSGTTYTLPSPLPTAGTYTNATIAVNSAGQITSASNGVGGITSFTITSNAVGTNTWTFNIPASYGRSYTYTLFTDTTPTTSSVGTQPKPMYGFPTINGSFISATGIGILQYYSSTSSNQITYCNGYQQDYTITAGGSAYMMNVISSIGATTLTWSYSTNGVNDNTNCPPSANAGFTTTYTLTSSGSVASCFAKLVGIVVAS